MVFSVVFIFMGPGTTLSGQRRELPYSPRQQRDGTHQRAQATHGNPCATLCLCVSRCADHILALSPTATHHPCGDTPGERVWVSAALAEIVGLLTLTVDSEKSFRGLRCVSRKSKSRSSRLSCRSSACWAWA